MSSSSSSESVAVISISELSILSSQSSELESESLFTSSGGTEVTPVITIFVNF